MLKWKTNLISVKIVPPKGALLGRVHAIQTTQESVSAPVEQ